MSNELPFGGFPKFSQLNEEESTIATWLKDVGYQTMLAGKYLNAFPDSDDPFHIPLGWTDWFSPMEGRAYEQFNYTLNENGEPLVYGNEPDDYGTDVYAAKTIDFIERSASEGSPFFAYVAVYAPHYPTTPAPRHADLFPNVTAPRSPNYDEADVSDKPAYIRGLPRLSGSDEKRIDDEWRLRLQSMMAVDEMIGAIVDTLKILGQLEDTYLFFTSDNGYHLGNHRQLLGKGAPYEEEVRVTMIVRGPGVPIGKTLDHLIGNTDLAPTWAEIAGAEAPDFVDGRSIVSLLSENAPSLSSWRQSYLLEHAPYDSPSGASGERETPTNTPAELLEPPDPDQENGGRAQVSSPTGAQVPPYRAIRTMSYCYIEYPTGERELYDMEDDPYQLENIVDSANPDLVAELASRVKELQQCSGEDCHRVEDKPIVN
jgi:arylsulfatase A-like enzyme